ncbi:MAG: hypothetical protein A2X93_00225 [Deltaproteobacteria bacterium GWC2_56_8]|nr:MAG: hypothetical protein A2X99_01045 [Deltaproteobacteria bacterium GWB2_55_19]OGP38726.1 MAG: hypothetical protein A2X93_00225 [Deltaproteobacteria bacterium GWC2_56_8]
MRDSMKYLERIQRIDLEIKGFDEEGKSYALKLENLASEIEAAKKNAETLGQEAEAIRALIKGSEEKIRESAERTGKDEKKMGAVKNDRELSALTKEINAANKTKKLCEMEMAAHAQKLDEKNAALKAAEDFVAGKTVEAESLKTEIEAKNTEWKEALGKKEAEKTSLKANVRPEVFRKYEMIRSRRGGLGLALVKNETCQGCYIHIPPQVYIQLKRGTDELMTCPHCHRILYVESQGQLEAI